MESLVRGYMGKKESNSIVSGIGNSRPPTPPPLPPALIYTQGVFYQLAKQANANRCDLPKPAAPPVRKPYSVNWIHNRPVKFKWTAIISGKLWGLLVYPETSPSSPIKSYFLAKTEEGAFELSDDKNNPLYQLNESRVFYAKAEVERRFRIFFTGRA